MICWVGALCLVILGPFQNVWLHSDNKCGHVPLSLLWHSVQLGLKIFWDHNRFFIHFSMYWVDLDMSICVIWLSAVCCVLHNKLDGFRFHVPHNVGCQGTHSLKRLTKRYLCWVLDDTCQNCDVKFTLFSTKLINVWFYVTNNNVFPCSNNKIEHVQETSCCQTFFHVHCDKQQWASYQVLQATFISLMTFFFLNYGIA